MSKTKKRGEGKEGREKGRKEGIKKNMLLMYTIHINYLLEISVHHLNLHFTVFFHYYLVVCISV